MSSDTGDKGAEARGRGRKKRRRVVHVNEVDRELILRGLPPSWEQSASDLPGTHGGASSDDNNDERLLSELPPHWHPRL